jgi:hypothetical protein
MSAHCVVTVATQQVFPEVLCNVSCLKAALHAIEVVGLLAPSASAALHLWDDDRPNGGAILRVEDGRWRVGVGL